MRKSQKIKKKDQGVNHIKNQKNIKENILGQAVQTKKNIKENVPDLVALVLDAIEGDIQDLLVQNQDITEENINQLDIKDIENTIVHLHLQLHLKMLKKEEKNGEWKDVKIVADHLYAITSNK